MAVQRAARANQWVFLLMALALAVHLSRTFPFAEGRQPFGHGSGIPAATARTGSHSYHPQQQVGARDQHAAQSGESSWKEDAAGQQEETGEERKQEEGKEEGEKQAGVGGAMEESQPAEEEEGKQPEGEANPVAQNEGWWHKATPASRTYEHAGRQEQGNSSSSSSSSSFPSSSPSFSSSSSSSSSSSPSSEEDEKPKEEAEPRPGPEKGRQEEGEGEQGKEGSRAGAIPEGAPKETEAEEETIEGEVQRAADAPLRSAKAMLRAMGDELVQQHAWECNVFGGEGACMEGAEVEMGGTTCSGRVDCAFQFVAAVYGAQESFDQRMEENGLGLCPSCRSQLAAMFCGLTLPACGTFDKIVDKLLPGLSKLVRSSNEGDGEAAGSGSAAALGGRSLLQSLMPDILRSFSLGMPCREMCEDVISTCACGNSSITLGQVLDMLRDAAQQAMQAQQWPAEGRGQREQEEGGGGETGEGGVGVGGGSGEIEPQWTQSGVVGALEEDVFALVRDWKPCDLFSPKDTKGFSGRCPVRAETRALECGWCAGGDTGSTRTEGEEGVAALDASTSLVEVAALFVDNAVGAVGSMMQSGLQHVFDAAQAPDPRGGTEEAREEAAEAAVEVGKNSWHWKDEGAAPREDEEPKGAEGAGSGKDQTGATPGSERESEGPEPESGGERTDGNEEEGGEGSGEDVEGNAYQRSSSLGRTNEGGAGMHEEEPSGERPEVQQEHHGEDGEEGTKWGAKHRDSDHDMGGAEGSHGMGRGGMHHPGHDGEEQTGGMMGDGGMQDDGHARERETDNEAEPTTQPQPEGEEGDEPSTHGGESPEDVSTEGSSGGFWGEGLDDRSSPTTSASRPSTSDAGSSSSSSSSQESINKDGSTSSTSTWPSTGAGAGAAELTPSSKEPAAPAASPQEDNNTGSSSASGRGMSTGGIVLLVLVAAVVVPVVLMVVRSWWTRRARSSGEVYEHLQQEMGYQPPVL